MANVSDEWELSKENIQPLQEGRKPEVLKLALLSQKNEISHQQQTFENELRTYTGNDPLAVWYRYIKWVEQNFPKGGKDGHLLTLIEQCLTVLKDKTQHYCDDKRFIDLWLKYCRFVTNVEPLVIYDYMYSNKIGCNSAIFFQAWAWELEQKGNLKQADFVLKTGIECQAEPFEKLKSYYSQFDMRFATKVMAQTQQESEENGRLAFSSLKPQKKKTAPIARIGETVLEPNRTKLIIGRQQPFPKSNVPPGKVPFKIHNVENVPCLPVQTENSTPYVLHSDISKENEKKPSKWNKVKAKQQIKTASRSVKDVELGFKLHCDQGEQPSATPRSIPKVSNILRARKGSFSPAVALFEPPDPMKRPMYDKKKVYGGAEEFSLEEIRAAEWFKQREVTEKEKMLAEHEKLILQHQEQIKNLVKEIETLRKTERPSVAVKPTDNSNIPSAKNSLPYFQPISLPDDNVNIQSSALSRPCANFSSAKFHNKSCQKELFPDPKYTVSYHEASGMVRDLYNGTFMCNAQDASNTDCSSMKGNTVNSLNSSVAPSFSQVNFKPPSELKSLPEKDTLPKTIKLSLPFTLYSDPNETFTQGNVNQVQKTHIPKIDEHQHCASNQENILQQKDEDIENVPPKEYVQEPVKRQLSGILEPSINIHYVPLEEQELDNSDEELDLYKENNNRAYQDETLVPPCNTEQFVSAPFLSSTPRVKVKVKENPALQEQNTKPESDAPVVLKTSEELIKPVSKEEFKTLKDQSTYPPPPAQLSVIMETSRECYKSSSSSGSSASVTKLSQFSQCYSHEKSNIQKHLSRGEIFKEPRLIPKDISNLMQKEASFHTFKEPKPVCLRDSVKEVEVFEIHVSDINPFDEELMLQRLQSLKLSKNQMELLQISKKSVCGLKASDKIQVKGNSISLKRLVAEGAFGKVYEAEKRHRDATSKAAVKVCKQPNSWELYICATLHERLEVANCCPDVRLSVMKITSAVQFVDGIMFVSEFSQMGTLLNLVNNYKMENRVIPECIAFYLTLEMLQIMSKIHECNIIHADIKPDNILFCNGILNFDLSETLLQKKTKILKFIDFGRSIDLNIYKRGICFKTVLKEKCIEMRDDRPWVFQLDWYGILNCIHVLLFLEYMKVRKNASGRWEIEKKFKRYWNQGIWVPLFDELLNIPSCYQQPNIEKYTNLIDTELQKGVSLFHSYFKKLLN